MGKIEKSNPFIEARKGKSLNTMAQLMNNELRQRGEGGSITPQTIHRWCKGETFPNVRNLEAWCSITGTDPNFYYEVERESTNSPSPGVAAGE